MKVQHLYKVVGHTERVEDHEILICAIDIPAAVNAAKTELHYEEVYKVEEVFPCRPIWA